MSRKTLWLAAFVVILSNAIALGFAWINRSGRPDAVLTLTEREVRLLPREAENTALVLRLAWVDPSAAEGAMGWLDAARLASLGFDCSRPVTRANARHYVNQPGRAAYAAFEFEGDAWNQYLASVPEGAEREAARSGSHLVLVDVGLDPAALRARHPDRQRVLITRAAVQVVYRETRGAHPTLSARVVVHPSELSVPRPLRAPVERLAPQPVAPYQPEQARRGTPLAGAPRYEVSVAWGRSFEPWIEAIR